MGLLDKMIYFSRLREDFPNWKIDSRPSCVPKQAIRLTLKLKDMFVILCFDPPKKGDSILESGYLGKPTLVVQHYDGPKGWKSAPSTYKFDKKNWSKWEWIEDVGSSTGVTIRTTGKAKVQKSLYFPNVPS